MVREPSILKIMCEISSKCGHFTIDCFRNVQVADLTLVFNQNWCQSIGCCNALQWTFFMILLLLLVFFLIFCSFFVSFRKRWCHSNWMTKSWNLCHPLENGCVQHAFYVTILREKNINSFERHQDAIAKRFLR